VPAHRSSQTTYDSGHRRLDRRAQRTTGESGEPRIGVVVYARNIAGRLAENAPFCARKQNRGCYRCDCAMPWISATARLRMPTHFKGSVGLPPLGHHRLAKTVFLRCVLRNVRVDERTIQDRPRSGYQSLVKACHLTSEMVVRLI
jgi:hypothetical protein